MFMMKGTEREILRACLDFLEWKRIFHFRSNSGALPITDKYGKSRFIRFGKEGCPDILVCIKGRFIGIECKAENGKQSESQKDFQNKLEKAGGLYWLIKDVSELEKYVEEII